MARNNGVAFDYVKLEAELRRRGLSMRDASQEMGYSRNYLSSCKYEGIISKPAVTLLESLYGVKPEQFLVNKADEKPTEGVFNYDDMVEEVKSLRGFLKQILEEAEDICYAMNVLSQDLKEIKYDLVGGEKGDDNV